MDEIQKHLKAEAKIQEVHAIVDDLLASELKENPPKNLLNWKTVGISLTLFIALLSIWIWYTSNYGTKPINPENSKSVPGKSELVSKDFVTNKTESSSKIINSNSNSPLKKISNRPNEPASETKKVSNPSKKILSKNLTKKKKKENKLIAYNFSQVEWGNNNLRSLSNTAPEEQKTLAKEKYNSKVYNEALSIIESLNKEYPDDWELIFYRGVCQLEIPKINNLEAIKTFSLIIEHDDNPFIEDAEWLLIRAHHTNEDKILTKRKIEESIIRYPSHKYYDSAKQLYDLLDK